MKLILPLTHYNNRLIARFINYYYKNSGRMKLFLQQTELQASLAQTGIARAGRDRSLADALRTVALVGSVGFRV